MPLTTRTLIGEECGSHGLGKRAGKGFGLGRLQDAWVNARILVSPAIGDEEGETLLGKRRGTLAGRWQVSSWSRSESVEDDFSPDQRLDAGLSRCLVEAWGSIDSVAIDQRHGRQTEFGSAFDEVFGR